MDDGAIHGFRVVPDAIIFSVGEAGLVPAQKGEGPPEGAATRVSPRVGGIVGAFK